ncbi:UNVERIFIED_CONTAM: hypothetical protein Sradi_4343300 [Sesamum radiatum]|uniref:Uncharacterized protein n=1 Tax=Sesamum radiatum TaxID=300843 RepID=A0AAW2NMN1_SESRA
MESAELVGAQKDRVRIKRKTLEAMLQQCQVALQQLASGCDVDDDDDDDDDDVDGESDAPQDSGDTSSAPASCETDTTEFYDLLKSRVECADFLKKLENARATLPESIAEEGSSWDMVSENDLWEGGNVDLDPEDYVLVGQEDIMDGIASFMAAYLLSLKQTKELTPNQLQAVKKKKGKLRKAWDGSKVIYNVASWGATAIGSQKHVAIYSRFLIWPFSEKLFSLMVYVLLACIVTKAKTRSMGFPARHYPGNQDIFLFPERASRSKRVKRCLFT